MTVEERTDLVGCTPLRGTPAEVGAAWGKINCRAIHRDLEQQFLAPARAAGVGPTQLTGQAEAFIRIAQRLAPHWPGRRIRAGCRWRRRVSRV